MARSEAYDVVLDLKQQNFVVALLQLTEAINLNTSVGELLKLYEETLLETFAAERIAVFVFHHRWRCTNEVNVASRQIDELLDILSQDTLLGLPEAILMSASKNFDEYFSVLHKKKPLLVSFICQPDLRLDEVKMEMTQFLQAYTNVLAMAIENKKLSRERRNHQFFYDDLERAAQLQNLLIPARWPNKEHIQMAGTYLPFHEVGGDYIDYIELSDDEFLFCIGDISGKGVAAAMLMSNLQANVHSFVKENLKLEEIIEQLNARVNEITKGDTYITLFLATFNFKTRQLQYICAGHNPALLVTENEEIKFLSEGCTLLGIFEKLPKIGKQVITLTQPFIIFSYTDGLTDIENEKNESIQIPVLANLIEVNQQQPAKEINQQVITYVNSFRGKRMLNDDVSLLTCKIF